MFIELQQIYTAGNIHINTAAISSMRTMQTNLDKDGELRPTFITVVKMINGDEYKVLNAIDYILAAGKVKTEKKHSFGIPSPYNGVLNE